jgi:L-lactate dehydrogenase complex protein LldF
VEPTVTAVDLGMPTVRPQPATAPETPLRWGPTFPEGAHTTLANGQLRTNLHHATRTIRDKRRAVTAELPDWEALRDAGAAIKAQVMADLPALLVQLEENVTARGGVVHWARDAAEANRIVTSIVLATGAREVVKVKSMATQEIGLNEALEAAGIDAKETDLAELIVQLAGDQPSHFLVPAIHRNRDEIREIFTSRMPDAPEGLTREPRELAAAARAHLRARFLRAEVGISGANMAIASTGTVSVVESEGNGRMCLTLPRTLVTVMGIEKLLPTFEDLEVFLQLLPRSSTGERMNPYTSMWTGVTPGDGPQEFHLVLLDNGRTRVLADELGREALHCIRCSACLNVCPVYERVGGHAYGSVYPGPIGAILTPQLLGVGSRDVGVHDPAATLPLRLLAVRRVLRGVPGQDRHPLRAGPPAREGDAPRRRRGEHRHGADHARRRRDPARRPPAEAPRWPRRARRAADPGSPVPPAALPGVALDGGPGRPAAARSYVLAGVRGDAAQAGGPMSEDARAEVLARITAALGGGARGPSSVPRAYRRAGQTPSDGIVELFVGRLDDYKARVERCAPDELPARIAAQLADAGSVVVPLGLDPAWLAGLSGVQVRHDEPPLAHTELDRTGAVLTACRVAVALTGTIVLDGGDGQGRRVLSLLPDRHVCVVRADQVVAGVPDAVALLADHPERPLTWISGPSATSDIELVRVEGVHGPRDLRVIVVG